MTIELPEQDVAGLSLTPAQVRLELAVGLYAGRQVSLRRAAKIAGMPYVSFMHEIGHRGICINYTVEDAEHDMRMADLLSGGRAQAMIVVSDTSAITALLQLSQETLLKESPLFN